MKAGMVCFLKLYLSLTAIALILVDPPLTHCKREHYGEDDAREYVHIPYQLGYQDFTSWSQLVSPLGILPPAGPPRTSPLEDLLYYLTAFQSSPEHPIGTP